MIKEIIVHIIEKETKQQIMQYSQHEISNLLLKFPKLKILSDLNGTELYLTAHSILFHFAL